LPPRFFNPIRRSVRLRAISRSAAVIASLVVRSSCRTSRTKPAERFPMAKINTRSQKWYGWLPDLPDQRDFAYRVIKPRIAKLPRKVDLRKKCSPIENQGDIGACTAHALVGALEFLELKDGSKFVDLSRLFVYYNERAIEGAVKEDSGAFLRDGIKSLAKQGVCPEKAWPYKVHGFAKKPDKNCYSAAKNHQI